MSAETGSALNKKSEKREREREVVQTVLELIFLKERQQFFYPFPSLYTKVIHYCVRVLFIYSIFI